MAEHHGAALHADESPLGAEPAFPAEAGRRFVAHARDMLESMRNVRDDVSSLLVEPSGPVVIGVPPTASVTLIPRIFATCREKWPNIQLAVRESYSADIYSGVLRNEIDIGLVHRRIGARAVVRHRIRPQRL